jgi:chemotaxis protein CheD
MSLGAGETVVRMGEFAVAIAPATMVTLGLGSCVAIVLHDSTSGIGSMAHVLLPAASLSRDRGNRARSVDTAVPLLVESMGRHGADMRRTTARVVGGAAMFGSLIPAGTMNMGERNVVATRIALRAAGIPVVGESVGGETSRSVWFDVARGTVTVRTIGRESAVL